MSRLGIVPHSCSPDFLKFVIRTLIISATLFSQCAFAADAGFPWLDELRTGVTANTNRLSTNAEVQALLAPLPAIAEPYNSNWAWLLSPRPLIGASISLRARPRKPMPALPGHCRSPARFSPNYRLADLCTIEVNQVYNDRPSPLTSRFLFRESIAIGYELNANWRIMAFADHGSVGNLSYRNIGLNRFGVLLGNKFGPSTRKPLIADSAPSLSTFSWAGPYVGFGVAQARSKFHFKSPTPDLPRRAIQSISPVKFATIWFLVRPYWGANSTMLFKVSTAVRATNASDVGLSVSSPWLATARGRIGTDVEIPFVSKRSLIFATGGVAFSRSQITSARMPRCNATNHDIGGGS